MRKSPKPPVEPSEEWWCASCAEQEPRAVASLLEHLSGAHGIAPPIKGNKQLMLHLDEADRYTSSYEWTIGDVKVQQTIVGPRHGGRR